MSVEKVDNNNLTKSGNNDLMIWWMCVCGAVERQIMGTIIR